MTRTSLLLALLMTTVAAGAASAGSEGFPMFCRGLQRFDHTVESSGALTVEAVFTRGTGPAGEMGKGVQPGACAWLDRGVAAHESGRLRMYPMTVFSNQYTVQYTTDDQGRTGVNVTSEASRALQQLVLVQAVSAGNALTVTRALKLFPQQECKGTSMGMAFMSTPTECATKCLQTPNCRGFSWSGADLKGMCTHLTGAPQCSPSKPGSWGGSR